MKIAKIVGSNSHLDYVARVVDMLDVAEPPPAEAFGFGRFVALRTDAEADLVGVIYDSRLINPEYSNFGPRLSPTPDLAHFSPDYLNEQGILIGILVLGSIDGTAAEQGVPRRAIAAGQDVETMSVTEISRFHTSRDGTLEMRYFSQINAHAGLFAAPLIEAIIAELETFASESDRSRLDVLKQSLLWQRTVGGQRL